jgi:hypothetical protein
MQPSETSAARLSWTLRQFPFNRHDSMILQDILEAVAVEPPMGVVSG